jgi:hypothetical protein
MIKINLISITFALFPSLCIIGAGLIFSINIRCQNFVFVNVLKYISPSNKLVLKTDISLLHPERKLPLYTGSAKIKISLEVFHRHKKFEQQNISCFKASMCLYQTIRSCRAELDADR